jgi:hypothetical protein
MRGGAVRLRAGLGQYVGGTHPCLFAGGAGPVGTGLLNPAGSVAQRVGLGLDYGEGGSQSVPDRAVSPSVSRPLSGAGDGTGHRLHPVGWHAPRRDPVCAKGTGRGHE